MPVSYVLPLLRHRHDPGLAEVTRYLRWLADRSEVIVADGSEPALFAEHDQLWGGFVTHVPVANRPRSYGKVIGVHAGLEAASHEAVVIADDDVRYDDQALEAMTAALESADLVRPQNYFDPLPWHAAWDTARTLLNRSIGSDSPGTIGVRRSFFHAMGGYADDVLYENLELIRTVAAAGGRVANRPDLHVRRLPPTTGRFWQQRPRQAYDDFAQPLKLAAFLLLLPGALVLAIRRRWRALAVAALAAVALAELGRRRAGGTAVFPPRTSWLAPAWLVERGVCVWVAVVYRLTGGVPYAGTRLKVAAHSARRLRRLATARQMAAVAEGRRSGTPTPAEGDHRSGDGYLPALGVLEDEVPPDQERSVGIGPDRHRRARFGR